VIEVTENWVPQSLMEFYLHWFASDPVTFTPSAPVAQWIEQWLPEPKVARSNRAGGAAVSPLKEIFNTYAVS
jgi:hypothetical protein